MFDISTNSIFGFSPYFFIKSIKSLLFSFGNKNFLIPDCNPPIILLSKPPIAVILPCKFISPVIATSFFIGILFKRL